MMRPEHIGELVAWLVASPRGLEIAPVVVTNFRDPFDR